MKRDTSSKGDKIGLGAMLSLALLSAASSLAQSPLRQDEVDWAATRVETQEQVGELELGYFPTHDDLIYLADRENPSRYGSSRHQGPDQYLERATGTFPYDRHDTAFYEEHRDVFEPANKVLRFFTPHDPVHVDFPGLTTGAFTANADMPILTRQLEPDLAHVKLGPLYLDLLWIGAGAMWTDFSPKGETPPAEGDDVAAYIDIAIRGYVRITDTIYFSMVGDFIYLPLENEIAVRALLGSRAGAVAQFVLQERVGTWDILFTDTLQLSPGVDIDAGLGNEGIDEAGRYHFGFAADNKPIRLDFEEEGIWVSNSVELRASSLIFNEDWRLWLQADHTDFWRTLDFEDHSYRDHFGAILGYEGHNIPFSPSLSYDITTNDYDTYRHTSYLGFRGRLTENIQTRFGGGYLWTTGAENDTENWLWDVSLHHRLSEGIGHGVTIGQNVFDDDLSPESVWTTYARYWINSKITHRLSAGAYAQWEESERLTITDDDHGVTEFERYSVGANLSYRPFDYTHITAWAIYQNTELQVGEREWENWLYGLNITQRLATRLTLEGYYRYEKSRQERAGFDEHLLGVGIKRYF
jgi:hypothetical protein